MLGALKEWFSSEDDSPQESEEHLIQRASAMLLFEVATADHEVTDTEREQLLASVISATTLKRAEAQSLLEDVERDVEALTSHHRFVRLLVDTLDVSERGVLLEQMWRVAYADGEVDRYEEHFIRRVADLLYLPHSRYIQAKLAAQETV